MTGNFISTNSSAPILGSLALLAGSWIYNPDGCSSVDLSGNVVLQADNTSLVYYGTVENESCGPFCVERNASESSTVCYKGYPVASTTTSSEVSTTTGAATFGTSSLSTTTLSPTSTVSSTSTTGAVYVATLVYTTCKALSSECCPDGCDFPQGLCPSSHSGNCTLSAGTQVLLQAGTQTVSSSAGSVHYYANETGCIAVGSTFLSSSYFIRVSSSNCQTIGECTETYSCGVYACAPLSPSCSLPSTTGTTTTLTTKNSVTSTTEKSGAETRNTVRIAVLVLSVVAWLFLLF